MLDGIKKPADPPEKIALEQINVDEEVRKFLSSLDRAQVIDAAGRRITLILKKESSPASGLDFPPNEIESYYIVFEVDSTPSTEMDYVDFSVIKTARQINLDFASIQSPDLRRKNIHPKVIKKMVENLPLGFKFTFIVYHKTSKDAIMSAKNKFDKGNSSLEELESEIKNSYLIRIRIEAGLNKFVISFKSCGGPDHPDTLITVDSYKIPNSSEILIVMPELSKE